MNLYKCSICGKIDRWTTEWRSYGSILLQDERPDLMACLCSPTCAEKFDARMERGEIVPAKAKPRGYTVKIKEPVGYSKQPPQRQLLTEYNETHRSP